MYACVHAHFFPVSSLQTMMMMGVHGMGPGTEACKGGINGTIDHKLPKCTVISIIHYKPPKYIINIYNPL